MAEEEGLVGQFWHFLMLSHGQVGQIKNYKCKKITTT
jgi:hypothetical protein